MCTNPRTCQLRVEGNGSIKVRPDIAVVIMGVVTENKELNQAQEENTKRMTTVLRSLHENGIPSEDIQTQFYNIIPQYDFIEGKQVFRGYKVEHNLEVTIRDMSRIGKIIDDAVQNGINQVSSFRFSIGNPSVYYQQALNAAVDDALKKAGTLGSKTGVPITPLMFQAAGAATPVQTGQIDISARIEAVFTYRPMY